MMLKAFKEKSASAKFTTPNYSDVGELETIYWDNMKKSVPLYGAGTNGSLMDCDVWNLGRLSSTLDHLETDYALRIEGVNSPYLYYGMWNTSFAWHTEDMDFYSISYLHFGKAKTWYAIPPKYGRRFEELARELFPTSYSVCPAFLRHKLTVISPQVLTAHNIPFEKVHNFLTFITIFSFFK